MDTIEIPTDADFLEALKNADSLERRERDELLGALAWIIYRASPNVARYLIGEISPARRVFTWISFSQKMDLDVMQGSLDASSLYRPEAIERGDEGEGSFDPPSREELVIFLNVISSCVSAEWAVARGLARSLKHAALLVQAYECIAVRSGLAVDDRAFEGLCHDLERAEKEPWLSWTYKCITANRALYFPPVELGRKLRERGNRLRRFLGMTAPFSMISAELCMLAEVGGVEEVLQVVAKNGFEFEGENQERYAEAIATGFIILGDLKSARVWGSLLAPAGRARVCMRIYAAKIIHK